MNILIVLLIIIALILIRAAFISPEQTIERSIIINKPREEVFQYIRILKNAIYYNKWVMADPNVKMEYKGTDGTVGFMSFWDSENKNVGKGEQEITKITDGERVEWEIRFIRPFEGISTAWMTTTSISDNQTTVSWVFKGTRDKYILKLMHVVFNLRKVLSKDMDTSLNNLKRIIEGNR